MPAPMPGFYPCPMLGVPIACWLGVHVAGFAAGAALAGLPLPWPLRSIGLSMMAMAVLGAWLAIEYLRCFDARRWRSWRLVARRRMRGLGARWSGPRPVNARDALSARFG